MDTPSARHSRPSTAWKAGAQNELQPKAEGGDATPEARDWELDPRLRGNDEGRAIEALLFASEQPLTIEDITRRLGTDNIDDALAELAQSYAGRGINLVERGGRWHFQTAPDMAHLLRETREASRKLSRAAIETLAIIAYQEPVSRAEIEAIRGVQISSGTLDVLMEAGWIVPAGRRQVPGRPLTYTTTPDFLTHFGLGDRRDLPGIDDLRVAGLLDRVSDDDFIGDLETAGEDD